MILKIPQRDFLKGAAVFFYDAAEKQGFSQQKKIFPSQRKHKQLTIKDIVFGSFFTHHAVTKNTRLWRPTRLTICKLQETTYVSEGEITAEVRPRDARASQNQKRSLLRGSFFCLRGAGVCRNAWGYLPSNCSILSRLERRKSMSS